MSADRRVSWWSEALEALSHTNLAHLAKAFPHEGLTVCVDLMQTMVRCVCGQQVSNQVACQMAQSVLEAAHNDSGHDLAHRLATMQEQELASCGITRMKARAIRSLAIAYLAGEFSTQALQSLNDELLVKHLTQHPGVGPWTAQMIMIFGLQRPDVFAVGDYGVKKACARFWPGIAPDELRNLWRPWGSAAMWLLWRSNTPTPIQY